MEKPMRHLCWLSGWWLCLAGAVSGLAGKLKSGPDQRAFENNGDRHSVLPSQSPLSPNALKNEALSANYFPLAESKGGWRTLLPENGAPDAERKAQILKTAGVDWDKLAEAWKLNTAAEGES